MALACGVFGRPFVGLEPYLDLSSLDEIDEEICTSLTRVSTEYTGGSHRTLGIVPPSLWNEPWGDYGEVIKRFSRAEFERFVALGDVPGAEFDPEKRRQYRFGEEAPYPLSRRQMLYLKYRHGVYFPWQVFYEMIPTRDWADKSHGAGKDFTPDAKRFFPKLVAFVRALPFAEIGRCNILGLDPYQHGTVHQDGALDDPTADHFITVCPRGNKRLFLWDERTRSKTYVTGRAYWFNDHGYHGVEADPSFRYSFRVDGVFREDFLKRIEHDLGAQEQKR